MCIRDRYKMIEARDPKVAQSSDVLVISLKGHIKGSAGDHEIDKDGVMVDLGDDQREVIPGIGAALLGAPLDAKDHAASWTIPDHEQVKKELVGQKAELKVTIK